MSELRLNRIFSRPLTQILLKTPLTPNQITVSSTLLGLTAGWLLSQGLYETSLLGAATYQFAVILDNCDGEVARAKNMRTKLGSWLDILGDILTDLALWLGVGLGMMKQDIVGPIGVFLALCLGGSLLHFLLVVLEKLKGFGPAVFNAPHPDHEKRSNVLLHIFDAFREGDASWFVVFFAALGHTDWLLWIGGVYMPFLCLSAIAINARWLFKK